MEIADNRAIATPTTSGPPREYPASYQQGLSRRYDCRCRGYLRRATLTISKDGIKLIGKGAVLVPPKKTVKNMCSGLSGPKTEAGICVQGKGIKMDKFVIEHRKVLSVERPVKDVSIIGFEVRKFSGINIAIIGARNTRVSKNTLTDGAKYGTLTAGSTKTAIEGNKVLHTGLGVQGIAICMDNLSDVHV
ncbi:hypothetical protein BGZ63DRAFT_100433 [Mariannaea sp. PMI_226]|nr:hypothetical protein BGZ63DRAFT_100433 [Mariannaea sp. PMI_226]